LAEPNSPRPERGGGGRPTLTSPEPPPDAQEAPDGEATLGTAPKAESLVGRSQLQLARERFLHHKPAVAGLIVFVVLLLVSTIGSHVWHYKFSQITGQFSTGPSLQHPFGTDTIGHDLFAQVLTGTATSMKTALVVAALATVVGTLIGALAGYYGKWADAALMRFTDLVLTVPLLAILLVLANTLGKQANSWLWIAIIVAALLWTYLARLVRGSFLSLREREFVEAEWALGASDMRIILRHMIPNALGPIVVNATLTVAGAMLIEAALSFLGLGIQPPEVSLGSLINDGQGAMTVLPWLFFFPSGVLIAIILSINFIGDGLRDALDPSQRSTK
jgi:peptide/nickel transport system permease protein